MAEAEFMRIHVRLEDPIPCAACGNAFVRSYYQQDRCRDCRRPYKNGKKVEPLNCVECGKMFKPRTSKQKFCRKECADKKMMKRETRVCVGCGKEYTPKRARQTEYCSRECAYSGIAAWHYQKKLICSLPPYSRLHACTCRHCGREFLSRRAEAVLCGDECKRADQSIAAPIQTCKQCGASYEYQSTGGGPVRFCSEMCRRISAKAAQKRSNKKTRLRYGGKHRSRARHFGVPYESVNVERVFERDGWRCQICGKSTPRKRRGTRYSNAPELDHRIPISRGGEHSYANTQCACRQCNMAKGNKSDVGQLPLLECGA